MARIATSGFEWQVIDTTVGRAENPEFQIAGSPVIDTSVQRSGDACLKCTTANHRAQWTAIGGQVDHWIYARTYLRVDGNSTTSANVLAVLAGAAIPGHIFLVQQGTGTAPKLRLRDITPAAVGSDSATLTINTWYRVELGVFVPTAGSGKLYFWLDDVLIASSDTASVGNTALDAVRVGLSAQTPGNSVSCYYDDVAINDTAGSTPTNVNQDGRPGEGRVVLLKPAADSARSGVTGGAGGTTNLFNAVDNTPPVGVATGSATDTSQIKAPANGDYYEATLQPYTDRLASTDLVTLIRPVAAVGPDSTNGGNIALSTTANPADATETVGAVGATAISTYPVGWAAVRGPVLYSPTVTLGTSPKVKVKRDSGLSVLHTCFVGLTVEYQRRLVAQISDTTTAADALGKAPGQASADTTTLTDSLTKAPGHTETDTAALSDALAKTSGQVLSDTATLSDATSKAPGVHPADTATLSDATSKAVGHAITDSASLTDALTTADTVVLGDSVTVTDQISPDLLEQFTQSVGDSVTVSDAVVLMASSPSGPAQQPGGGIFVPVIRTIKTEGHRLHFNDPVFLTDDLETDRRLSDLQRAEELALLA